MPKEDLKAKANELGLTVVRRDGKEGEPRVEDYEHAIAVHEGALLPDEPASGPTKTYEVTGPFPVFGIAQGGTFEAEVDAAGVITFEGYRALEAALLAQGAIQLEEGGSTDG